jgi:hypothetical protein
MPTVGQRRFPYTRAGMDAAKAYAKESGLRLKLERDDMDALSPERADPRNIYQTVSQSVEDRRRRRTRPAAQGDRYGRFGYAGETRREHEDRLWDRDWDEDTRGRRWHPTSRRAGER